MAFDKIVGVDGTTYNLPDAVRTKLSSNITTSGQAENTAVAAVVAAGITGKANTVHTHTVSQITDLTSIGSIPGVEIGVVGPNGIALADKHTLQYESSTSKWRNKVASGGVTVSATPPATPILGDAWFDSNDGTLYVYYSDGSSVQWVQVQANSALEGTILSRLGATEAEITSLETASPRTVSNATTRDTLIPSPVQGNTVFRSDTGRIETYHGLFNSSTNTGGRDTAGWYSVPESTGLVPIRPTSVATASGSASVGAVGLVTFSGATRVSLNGCFTSDYTNYRIIYNQNTGSATATDLIMRLRKDGTDNVSTLNYYYSGVGSDNSTVAGFSAGPQSNGYYYLGPIHNVATGTHLGSTIEIHKPNLTIATTLSVLTYGWNGLLQQQRSIGGFHNTTEAFDGFSLMSINSTTTFGGTVMVYGYNEK